MFRPTAIVWTSPLVLAVGFPEPVVLSGIPPLFAGAAGLPIEAEQVGAMSIELTYATPVAPGGLLELPDWTPSLRGINGEWVTGGAYRIGQSVNAGLPPLIYVVSITNNGNPTAGVEFSGAAFFAGFPLINIVSLGAPIGGIQVANSSWELTWGGDPDAGMLYEVDSWVPANATTDGFWLAPGEGLVL